MKFKPNKLLAGLLCSLGIASAAHADDRVAVFVTTVTDDQYVTLSAGQLRADIEQGIGYAIASAGATFTNGQDRYDWHAVSRDTLARAGIGIGITTLAYADKYGRATVGAIANRIGIDFAASALVTMSQEYLQIHLRNRWGIPKQVAKWSAFGLGHVVWGSWAYWAQPYIEYQLVEHFNGVHLNATSAGRRRQLLEITAAESFGGNIRSKPMVNQYIKAVLPNGSVRHVFYGNTYSAYGTPFRYGMHIEVPHGNQLAVKERMTCSTYPGQTQQCRTTYFL